MKRAKSTSAPSRRRPDLPARWAFKHGAYYYRPRPDERALFDGKSWFRLGTTYPDALRAFADRRELEMGDTLGAIIDRYTIEVLPSLKPQTRGSYGRALDLLREALGENPARLITPQLTYQYLELVARSRTMNVANQQLKMINVILDRAVRWGAVGQNNIRGQVAYFGKRDGLTMTRDRYVEDWELTAWEAKATPVQKAFAALAKLLQLRDGPAQNAARLVLVNGMTQADAARTVGLAPNAVHNAVARCRRGLELAVVAAG